MKRPLPLLIVIAALLAGQAHAAVDAKAKADKPKPAAEATTQATPGAVATGQAKADDAKASPSPTPEAKPASVSHKSNGIATTLAIIPGIVVHGAGHMYAGSWMTGLGLFAIGTGGAILAVDQGQDGWNDIQKLFNKNGDKSIPDDFSGGFSRVGPILVGTAAFLWTWWDDMSGASQAVDIYNKKADDAAKDQARIELLPSQGGAVLAYTRKF